MLIKCQCHYFWNALSTLLNECARLNESLSQNPRDTADINNNDLTDEVLHSSNDAFSDHVGSLNNQSPISSIDCSAASFQSKAADEPDISEDEQNMYVIYSIFFLFITKVLRS